MVTEWRSRCLGATHCPARRRSPSDTGWSPFHHRPQDGGICGRAEGRVEVHTRHFPLSTCCMPGRLAGLGRAHRETDPGPCAALSLAGEAGKGPGKQAVRHGPACTRRWPGRGAPVRRKVLSWAVPLGVPLDARSVPTTLRTTKRVWMWPGAPWGPALSLVENRGPSRASTGRWEERKGGCVSSGGTPGDRVLAPSGATASAEVSGAPRRPLHLKSRTSSVHPPSSRSVRLFPPTRDPMTGLQRQALAPPAAPAGPAWAAAPASPRGLCSESSLPGRLGLASGGSWARSVSAVRPSSAL